MDRADLQEFLAHYASDFYDPQKAHEYYLKTRELKGRRNTGSLNNYAKKQKFKEETIRLTENKKEDLRKASDEESAFVEKARQTAEGKRAELRSKITNLMKALSGASKEGSQDISNEQKAKLEEHSKAQKEMLDNLAKTHKYWAKQIADDQAAKAEKLADDQRQKAEQIAERQKQEAQRISEEAGRRVAALPPIPKGLSKEQKAEFAAKRAEDVAAIRGETAQAHEDLAAKGREDRVALSKEGKAQRRALSDEGAAKRDDLAEKVKAKHTEIVEKGNSEREAIVSEGRSQKQALSEEVSSERERSRADSNSQREQVGNELKATVAQARSRYDALKVSLTAQFEEKLTKSYDAIRQQ